MRNLPRALVPLVGCLLLALAAGEARAQAAAPAANAEVRTMIESLDPRQTRQRNIIVRPRPEAAAAAPTSATPAAPAATAAPGVSGRVDPPSLSLAIAFEPNSARLHPDSGATLGALMAAMISPELRARDFVIEGHTDAIGSPVHNQRLSQQRAEEVRLYLVTLGVAPERLRALGRGASDPANPRDPRSAENRRVRVLTLP